MLYRNQLGLVFCLVACAMSVGCSSPSSSRARNAVGQAPSANENSSVRESNLTSTAEAHAHYASAFIRELNDDSEGAFEEYFAAALADPSNELLVLDVSRKLLLRKQREKALELLEKAIALPAASESFSRGSGWSMR
jgi:hypothetical protein